jgi:hypothetical protein
MNGHQLFLTFTALSFTHMRFNTKFTHRNFSAKRRAAAAHRELTMGPPRLLKINATRQIRARSTTW